MIAKETDPKLVLEMDRVKEKEVITLDVTTSSSSGVFTSESSDELKYDKDKIKAALKLHVLKPKPVRKGVQLRPILDVTEASLN